MRKPHAFFSTSIETGVKCFRSGSVTIGMQMDGESKKNQDKSHFLKMWLAEDEVCFELGVSRLSGGK